MYFHYILHLFTGGFLEVVYSLNTVVITALFRKIIRGIGYCRCRYI